MPDNELDQYRERIVVETKTLWPNELGQIAAGEKARVAAALHAEPAKAKLLTYSRMHTGFCREITVTADDLQRLNARAG